MAISGPFNARDYLRDKTGYFETSSESAEFITCTSATRPSSPSEGNIIYETDTNLVYVYEGSAWSKVYSGSAQFPTENMPTGSVIQLATRTTGYSNAANYAYNSDCYCYITPLRSDSKILILISAPLHMASQGSDVGGGWGINSSAAGGLLWQTSHMGAGYDSTTHGNVLSVNWLHQATRPNATSNQYYQLYVKPYTNNSGTYIYMNRNYQGTDYATMTLMEIR